MFRNMAAALIKHEQITTTTAKAKELRPYVEKLITLAKRGGLSNRRLRHARLLDDTQLVKLFDVLAPRYAAREGGYIRIIKPASARPTRPRLRLSSCLSAMSRPRARIAARCRWTTSSTKRPDLAVRQVTRNKKGRGPVPQVRALSASPPPKGSAGAGELDASVAAARGDLGAGRGQDVRAAALIGHLHLDAFQAVVTDLAGGRADAAVQPGAVRRIGKVEIGRADRHADRVVLSNGRSGCEHRGADESGGNKLEHDPLIPDLLFCEVRRRASDRGMRTTLFPAPLKSGWPKPRRGARLLRPALCLLLRNDLPVDERSPGIDKAKAPR
jgi:ribosomal protein L17